MSNEPRIGYMTTDEGVCLAHTRFGGGEFVPKGFDEGVRIWDVPWREDG